MGICYETLGNGENAIAAYRRALALDSNFLEAHFNFGLLSARLGDTLTAAAEIETLETLSHEEAEALRSAMN
jgi:Flp pilus assembly protein TadD